MIIRFACFIVIPLIAGALLLYRVYLLQPLPEEGRKVVNGIFKQVTISRDNVGTAYITAETDADVYFAMGYVHAQDRMWQLEVQRRISQGRLSEIFGRQSLEQDIWFRTLRLYDTAHASISSLSVEAISSLNAYAAGVNAGMESYTRLPVEFSFYGIEPEPWTIQDSLAWAKVFALSLAGNYQTELTRYIGSQHLSDTQLATFFGGHDQGSVKAASIKSRDSHAAARSLISFGEDLVTRYGLGGRHAGSNAWVVSGSLTASGRPILANDPHLGLQIPSLWYAVTQKGNQLDVSGMSLVGLPVVIFGKNKKIAWGGTAMEADVQDLYFEHVNPVSPNQYREKNEWKEFEIHHETINIKPDFPAALRTSVDPVTVKIRQSSRGPIVSDVIGDFEQVIALQWTGSSAQDTSYETFYRLSYVSDWNGFKEAVAYLVAPTLNMFYADVNNNIGFHGAGKIPIRSRGQGMIPVIGSDDSYEWKGSIPFVDLPHEFNPVQGFLINANNDNTSNGYPYFISAQFATPERANRIEDLIRSKVKSHGKLTLDDMREIQGDVFDRSITGLLETVSRHETTIPEYNNALAQLREWDGQASRDSVGAAIYYGLYRHLKDNLFSDELDAYWAKDTHRAYLRSLYSRISADEINSILLNESEWCDDIATTPTERCANVIDSALEDLIKELSRLRGGNMDNWRWGKVQQAVYIHQPFSNAKMLDAIFERRVDSGGAANTINVAGSVFKEGEGYKKYMGAGFRQIIELSDPTRHLYMNSTGQSGQVASIHYDDMIEGFSEGRYEEFSDKETAMTVIILEPSGSGRDNEHF